jgi:hypothetical protein
MPRQLHSSESCHEEDSGTQLLTATDAAVAEAACHSSINCTLFPPCKAFAVKQLKPMLRC